ncbi:MAG TPA: TIGR00366 family protein [Thermoanaerobaculia bacterium]|nr:TIGR00366 family protein [Thermoanaerobaculia bacterium]
MTRRSSWMDGLAKGMERLVPDAITTSILLMLVLFGFSLALGNPLAATVDAYYRGLWMLLQFTMQMTLILVLSLVIAASPLFRGAIISLSRIPKTTFGVVAGACLCTATIAYMNWGLALALGPMVAIHFARQAEIKGLPVDFLFLQATLAGAGSLWQFGLSASAPLLVATPGHFLEGETGIMSLATTIWAPATLVHCGVFLVATVAAGYLLMPKRPRLISEFSESLALAEEPSSATPPSTKGGGLTPARWLELSPLTVLPLCLALSAWLYSHFFIKDLSLDINSLNTILLLSCFVLHRNIDRFTGALKDAIKSSWPIVVLYHLYAGVAGLIQYTPVGETLGSMFDPILTPYTLPLLVIVISTIVAIFIPTSGGQWVIQGAITVNAAESVGVTAQRGLLALSIGDHMGNLISPFWAVVGAGIARVDFRLLFGYRLIFAVLWIVIGTVVFTFLPC